MAKIDDLIAQVPDDNLRASLFRVADDLRRRKKFGLVFEEHVPETVLLPSAGIRVGSQVMLRREPENPTRYVVDKISRKGATVVAGEETLTLPLADLLVVKAFGEPVTRSFA